MSEQRAWEEQQAADTSESAGVVPGETPPEAEPSPSTPHINLDAIERDLTDVQRALDRLNDGSYWTDEVTGETIPDDVLVANPLTRTVAASR